MNKRIGILYPFTGKTFGGSHVSVINMVKKLDKKLFHPIIFLHKKGKILEVLKKEKIEFIYDENINLVESNNFIQFFIFSLKNYFKMTDIFKTNDIDIVHSNDGLIHATWNIPVLLSGKKFVWHMRSRDNSRRLIIYSIFANQILSVSNYCKKNLPPLLNKKVRVIKNFFSHDLIKKPEITNKKIIAYVANYKQQKRPELFFKIANEVFNSNIKNINFYIFGTYSNNDKNKLLRLINKESCKNKISFMGLKFPMGPWIRKSTLTLSLGKNEGFGRVLIESMLNKSLVIATSGGAHEEIIKNGYNGIIVNGLDPKDISKKILFYLENQKKMKKIIDRAFSYSKKNFITLNTSKEIEDLYCNIL